MSVMTTAQGDVTHGEVQAAAMKAAGFDRVDPATRVVVAEMARRYGLELMLRHLLPVEGKPYITRDGLLHVAHKSGQLDGIVLEEEGEAGPGAWWALVSVYRKDMKHPFRYKGRYVGSNKKYGPEMAVKCAEVMALRRAFDVSLCSIEEIGLEANDVPTHAAPPHAPDAARPFMDADRAGKLRAIVTVNKIPTEVVKAQIMAATGGRVVEKGAAGIPLYSQAEYESLVAALKAYKPPTAPEAANEDAEPVSELLP